MLEWLAYYWPTILVCLALGGIVFAIHPSALIGELPRGVPQNLVQIGRASCRERV